MGEERGAVAVEWDLSIFHNAGNDSDVGGRHWLEEEQGLFMEWPGGRGMTALCFLDIKKNLLSEYA